MLWRVLSPITGVFITFARNIATLLKDFCALEQKVAKKMLPLPLPCLSVCPYVNHWMIFMNGGISERY